MSAIIVKKTFIQPNDSPFAVCNRASSQVFQTTWTCFSKASAVKTFEREILLADPFQSNVLTPIHKVQARFDFLAKSKAFALNGGNFGAWIKTHHEEYQNLSKF